jgi:hypothetical protein
VQTIKSVLLETCVDTCYSEIGSTYMWCHMYALGLHKKLQWCSHLHPSVIYHKSEVRPIFSKSLKTFTMISGSASTTQQEKAVHNSTWEVKFKMFQEFQASHNHVKVTQFPLSCYTARSEMEGNCKRNIPSHMTPCITKGLQN